MTEEETPDSPAVAMIRAEVSQALATMVARVENRAAKAFEAAYKFVVREARFPCPFGSAERSCECAPHRSRLLLDEHSPRWAEYER